MASGRIVWHVVDQVHQNWERDPSWTWMCPYLQNLEVTLRSCTVAAGFGHDQLQKGVFHVHHSRVSHQVRRRSEVFQVIFTCACHFRSNQLVLESIGHLRAGCSSSSCVLSILISS